MAKSVNHTAAVTSATPLLRAPMSGILVVCIENDPAILDGMRTLLTTWDAKVIAAADPEAAIKAIESPASASPDCWSIITSIAATASRRSATSASVSARPFRRS